MMSQYDQDGSPMHANLKEDQKGVNSARLNGHNIKINKNFGPNDEAEWVQYSSRVERVGNFIDKNKENGRENDYQDGGNVPDLHHEGTPVVFSKTMQKRAIVKGVDIKNEERYDQLKSHEGYLNVNA